MASFATLGSFECLHEEARQAIDALVAGPNNRWHASIETLTGFLTLRQLRVIEATRQPVSKGDLGGIASLPVENNVHPFEAWTAASLRVRLQEVERVRTLVTPELCHDRVVVSIWTLLRASRYSFSCLCASHHDHN